MATIGKDHVRMVCRIGQGPETCRYLVIGEDAFCAKSDPGLIRIKNTIDARIAEGTMGAQGDNCPGLGVEEPS